jgi:hypothetical protein
MILDSMVIHVHGHYKASPPSPNKIENYIDVYVGFDVLTLVLMKSLPSGI